MLVTDLGTLSGARRQTWTVTIMATMRKFEVKPDRFNVFSDVASNFALEYGME
jgi:hypothetical protein